MYSKKKTWIIHAVLIVIIILITYMQATIYNPFNNVVEIEKMVEPTSKIKITNSNQVIDANSESFRVKIHNLFNDLKLSRNFFASKSQISLPNYVIELKYISIDNKEIISEITVFDNGNININGEIFITSNNIYNKLENIIAVGN